MTSSSSMFRFPMGSKIKYCAVVTIVLWLQFFPGQGRVVEESIAVGDNIPLSPSTTGQIETVNGKVPRTITEGGLIKALFNLGFSALNHYAQEAKMVKELQLNGTDPESLFKNGTTVNATGGEDDDNDHRYFQRHGYVAEGNHMQSDPILFKKNGTRGEGPDGFGKFSGGVLLNNLSSAAKHLTKTEGFGKSFGYEGQGRHDYGLQTTTTEPPQQKAKPGVHFQSNRGNDADTHEQTKALPSWIVDGYEPINLDSYMELRNRLTEGITLTSPYSSYDFGSLYNPGRSYGLGSGMGNYGSSFGGGSDYGSLYSPGRSYGLGSGMGNYGSRFGGGGGSSSSGRFGGRRGGGRKG